MHYLFVLLLLLLNGCEEHAKALPYPIEIKENKVGPITADLEFSAAKINGRLPGFDVVKYTHFRDGKSHILLRIMYRGKEVMLIEPATDGEQIAHVSVTSKAIPHKKVHVGMEFQNTLSSSKMPTCRLERGLVACDKSPKIRYLFAQPGGQPATAMPDAQNIASWPLAEIVWTP